MWQSARYKQMQNVVDLLACLFCHVASACLCLLQCSLARSPLQTGSLREPYSRGLRGLRRKHRERAHFNLHPAPLKLPSEAQRGRNYFRLREPPGKSALQVQLRWGEGGCACERNSASELSRSSTCHAGALQVSPWLWLQERGFAPVIASSSNNVR